MGLVTGYGSIRSGIENQAWWALQDVKAAGTVQYIDFIETNDTRDRAANIAYFVDSGYDIVVTTGGGIFADTVAAADRHPEILFVAIQPGVDPAGIPSNLIKLEFREEHAGYLAGAAAAMVTKTKHVAAVCEARFIDYVERYCEGFAAGVRSIEDDVQAEVVYRQGADEVLFRDLAWGAAAAARLVDGGVDVVFAVGEATAASALVEAANRGALVIGAQVDAFYEQPDIRERLVTSATLDVRDSLASLILASLNGQLAPGTYWGHVSLAPFHTFEDQVQPRVAGALRRIQADLAGGQLVPNLPVLTP